MIIPEYAYQANTRMNFLQNVELVLEADWVLALDMLSITIWGLVNKVIYIDHSENFKKKFSFFFQRDTVFMLQLNSLESLYIYSICVCSLGYYTFRSFRVINCLSAIWLNWMAGPSDIQRGSFTAEKKRTMLAVVIPYTSFITLRWYLLRIVHK